MKAVLFDFGGTIDTDGVHWSETFWGYYERFGIGIAKADYERAFVAAETELGDIPVLKQATFYETLHKQLRLQFKFLKLDARDPRLQSMLDACYRDVDGTIRKAREVIRLLAERYRLAVVSNFYGNLETVCQEFEIYPYFTAVVDSVRVGLRKPDPAIWDLALKNLEVKAENSWAVGDSYERDVVPAKLLGCRTVWLKGKSWRMPATTDAADHTIQAFAELKGLLL